MKLVYVSHPYTGDEKKNVVFCGKWRKSKGCMAEYREAEKLGLKIEVEGES